MYGWIISGCNVEQKKTENSTDCIMPSIKNLKTVKKVMLVKDKTVFTFVGGVGS